VKTLADVLKDQGRTRAQSVAELAAAAVAPARVDSRVTPRNARDPLNRYDPAHPARDPRETPTIKGTPAPASELREPTAEEQKILNVLANDTAACARFRKERGIKPVLS